MADLCFRGPVTVPFGCREYSYYRRSSHSLSFGPAVQGKHGHGSNTPQPAFMARLRERITTPANECHWRGRKHDETEHIHTSENSLKKSSGPIFFSDSSSATVSPQTDPIEIVVLTSAAHYVCSGGRSCVPQSTAEIVRSERSEG